MRPEVANSSDRIDADALDDPLPQNGYVLEADLENPSQLGAVPAHGENPAAPLVCLGPGVVGTRSGSPTFGGQLMP